LLHMVGQRESAKVRQGGFLHPTWKLGSGCLEPRWLKRSLACNLYAAFSILRKLHLMTKLTTSSFQLSFLSKHDDD
jgi:hypothetical protein